MEQTITVIAKITAANSPDSSPEVLSGVDAGTITPETGVLPESIHE
jgi:hypothetical protein